MVRAELEKLIRSSLAFLGARELERHDGVIRFELAEGLGERLGRRDLSITFSSAVAAQTRHVELISAGSFMCDLLLRIVQEQGRAAQGWLMPDSTLRAPSLIARLNPRLEGRTLSRIEASWGMTYLFTFRLGFYFDTPYEKLYTVRVDSYRDRVKHETHPERLLEQALAQPTNEPGDLQEAGPDQAFRLGWGKVEEEIARLTEKYEREGRPRLEEEIRTVELYYRQLIEEEKEAREQRNSRQGRADSDNRIEMLKLEWDRRIAEEKSRLSPEVSAVLSCASGLRVPLERWRAKADRRRRLPAADFCVDLHAGEVWVLQNHKRRRRALRRNHGPSTNAEGPHEPQ
jgi:hypothetical protein